MNIGELSFDIKYIMGAKNFTKEQAKNFLKHYEHANEDITLYEFIIQTGDISPIVSTKILKLINDN